MPERVPMTLQHYGGLRAALNPGERRHLAG